jgi:hypothetical protein
MPPQRSFRSILKVFSKSKRCLSCRVLPSTSMFCFTPSSQVYPSCVGCVVISRESSYSKLDGDLAKEQEKSDDFAIEMSALTKPPPTQVQAALAYMLLFSNSFCLLIAPENKKKGRKTEYSGCKFRCPPSTILLPSSKN